MAVLYCVGNAGFLLKALVHKFTYHPNEELILVLHFNLNKYDYKEVSKQVCFCKFYNIEESNEENLFSYWEKKLEGIVFSQITNSYIMFDVTNNIGAYFEKINHEYSLIELSTNQLYIQSTIRSQPQYMLPLIQSHFDILDKYGVTDSRGAHCVKHYLHSSTNKIVDGEIPNEVFNYEKLLCGLDKETVKKLFGIYPKPQLPNVKINLLCLNSDTYVRNAIKNFLNIQLTDLSYQSVIDYYLPENSKIAIKGHPSNPDGVLGNKKNYPSGTAFIGGDFPSDLMQFCENIKIDTSITIASTSVEYLDRISQNIITLGRNYFAFFTSLNRYFVSFKIAEKLKENFKSYVFQYKYPDQVYNFLKYSFKTVNRFVRYTENFEIGENTFLIVSSDGEKDDVAERLFEKADKSGSGSLIVFIASNEKSRNDILSKYKNKFSVFSLKIKKTPIKEELLTETTDEEILIFTNNAKAAEDLKTFSVMRTLKYTGVILTAAFCNGLSSELLSFAETTAANIKNYTDIIKLKDRRISGLKKQIKKTKEEQI